MVIEILTLIGTLAAATSVYFQSQDPVRNKRRACASLTRFLDALESIAHTGEQIGETLDGVDDRQRRKEDLNRLVHLLEVQNDNLRHAQKELDTIERILKVKASTPALSAIHLHLRGKNHRIDILYDAAKIEAVNAEVEALRKNPYMEKANVEPWEVSEIGTGEERMRELLATAVEANDINSIDVGINLRQEDIDFAQIVEAIRPLRLLIDSECDPGDLI